MIPGHEDEGKEINGLTLAGVGAKTIIEHVTVRYNKDDCFEFFGGDVNPSHLICQGAGDDAFDLEPGYKGRILNSEAHIIFPKNNICSTNHIEKYCKGYANRNEMRSNKTTCTTVLEASNEGGGWHVDIKVQFKEQGSNRIFTTTSTSPSTLDLTAISTNCIPPHNKRRYLNHKN